MDHKVHEVNQVDCTLNDVLFGLRQSFGRIPTRLNEEEVMETAIKVSVKLAQVLPSVTLSNTVFLPLVIPFVFVGHAVFAFLPAQLQWRLAFDILRRNKGQYFRL